MKKYKVLFADLDGTLIKTASGKMFAEDCTDFWIRKDVLDKIKDMGKDLERVFIVSNQGGVPSYVSEWDLNAKINSIKCFVQAYCLVACSYDYCTSLNASDYRRKPNTGMLQYAWDGWISRYGITKEECLMIGDASGKEGQFSDSDKKCAENFGIDYLDVEDFLNNTKLI